MVAQLPKVPSSLAQTLTVTWDPLPSDYILPDDPVENIQQPLLAAALTDALGETGWIQPDMLIASNFGLVAFWAGRDSCRHNRRRSSRLALCASS